MKKKNESIPEFVVCINNEGYPASLELHKIYRVVPDKNAAADEGDRDVRAHRAQWFKKLLFPSYARCARTSRLLPLVVQYTERDENIRIIGCLKATRSERKKYEEKDAQI